MATRKTRGSRRSAAAKKRTPRKSPAKKVAAKKPAKKKRLPAKSPARKSASVRVKSRSSKTAKARARAAKKIPATSRAKGRASGARKPAAVAGGTASPRKAASVPIDTSLFPCGDAAVRAATGKTWNEWLALLDAAGAAGQAFDHQRIWDLAMQSLPESAGWWGQMVSVGYERVRGLREKHESCSGDFQSTLSKTLPVPLFAAFAAWADEGLRRNWLDAPGLDFTKLNAGKNIRARWPNGALLDIRFTATGPDKCQVVVDTMKLADAEAVQQAKAFWQAQLERLRGYLRV